MGKKLKMRARENISSQEEMTDTDTGDKKRAAVEEIDLREAVKNIRNNYLDRIERISTEAAVQPHQMQ